MPITLEPVCSGKLSIEEFIEYMDQNGDLSCADGLAESASQFRQLANDIELIPGYFNRTIKRFLDDSGPLATYTPQSVFLGAGRNFFFACEHLDAAALIPGFSFPRRACF